MSFINLSVAAPHATSYDEDYPTRSTENYSHALHEILKDMDDAGNWYLNDGVPISAAMSTYADWYRAMIKTVFDYAKTAIAEHRSDETITITEPTASSISWGGSAVYPEFREVQTRLWADCLKMMYKIYYMWKTEEDPLLLKEKLQELLIAWPLLDTTIELSSELGQQFKVYPSWKNADLDL